MCRGAHLFDFWQNGERHERDDLDEHESAADPPRREHHRDAEEHEDQQHARHELKKARKKKGAEQVRHAARHGELSATWATQ